MFTSMSITVDQFTRNAVLELSRSGMSPLDIADRLGISWALVDEIIEDSHHAA